MAIYREQSSLLSKSPRAKAIAGLHLVQGYMRATEPEVAEVFALLTELESTVSDPDVPASAKAEWHWWNVVVALYGAGQEQLADESAFAQWHAGLRAHTAATGTRLPAQTTLFAAADYLVGAAAESESIVDRVERVFVDLQLDLACPSLTVPLQQRRIRLLAGCQRYNDALHECRILLALAASNGQALSEAVDQTKSVLRAAGQEEAATKLAAFLCHGTDGPAGQPGTPDDRGYCLAKTARSHPYLQQWADRSSGAGDNPIGRGYALLLRGEGDAAKRHFADLIASDASLNDDEMRAVLEGVTAATCLTGCEHPGSEAFALSLLYGEEAASVAPRWRDAARQYVGGRVGLVRQLVAGEQHEFALAMCTAIVNDARRQADHEDILQIALDLVQRTADDPSPAGMSGAWQQFGRGLALESAATCWVRLAAQKLYSSDDPTTALALIEAFAREVPSIHEDPEVVMLAVGCLLRDGKMDQALVRVRDLLDRLDVSPDARARANLLVAAIHLQQARVIDARQALATVLVEAPESEHAKRAAAMLEKL
ncbi:MAG TPA: hypothetical protein VMZ31_05240 [Phycisphaerae bacterium]|nr:hypothetical protein [Phycisphaerae bacterium]